MLNDGGAKVKKKKIPGPQEFMVSQSKQKKFKLSVTTLCHATPRQRNARMLRNTGGERVRKASREIRSEMSFEGRVGSGEGGE